MRRIFTLPLLLLLGCTQSSDGIDGNAVTAPVEPRFAAADLDRGEILSLACQACHTLDAGQADLLGPNLYGVFGRVSAGSPGFGYSSVLRSANHHLDAESARRLAGQSGGFPAGQRHGVRRVQFGNRSARSHRFPVT